MADLFKRACQWLGALRKGGASSQVVYRRGSATVTLAATVGRYEFDVDDGAGGAVRVEMRDYLIETADLILSGAATLPKDGDLIVEGDGATYEVVGPGGVPAWRYSDPFKNTLRIHTKQATG